MPALTKKELTRVIEKEVGLARHVAAEIVELFFTEIRYSLERGENVFLSGFGNFNLRDKKTRLGRNPMTGQLYDISQRRVVTFKAGNKFKERLKGVSAKLSHCLD